MKISHRLSALSVLLLAACPGAGGGGDGTSWSRSFGGAMQDEAALAVAASDGGYLFVGTAEASYDTRVPGDFDQRDGDVWVTRLDGAGNLSWQRTYGERSLSPGGNTVRYRRVRPASGGGFWLAGSESASDTPTGDPFLDGGNLAIARADAAGTVLWRRIHDSGPFGGYDFSFTTGTTHEYLRDLWPTPDGGLVLACWLSARVDKPAEGRSGVEVNGVWIAKVDADGDLLWHRHFTGGASGELDRYFPYTPSPGVELWVRATSDSGAIFGVYSLQFDFTRLGRLESNGSVHWAVETSPVHLKACAGIDDDGDGTPDGDFLLVGSLDPGRGSKGYARRMDDLGRLVWEETIGEVRSLDTVGARSGTSGGVPFAEYAAAGSRFENGQHVVRIQVLDSAGNRVRHRDPYHVEAVPAIRWSPGAGSWLLLARSLGSHYLAYLAPDLTAGPTSFLGRAPELRTLTLMADGALDLRNPDGASETVVALQRFDGTVEETAFAREGLSAERAHAVVETDSGWVVLGESSRLEGLAIWLLALHPDGTPRWQRRFENASFFPTLGERFDLLRATPDGGLVFAARVQGHVRAVRLDADGHELWNSEPLAPEVVDFSGFGYRVDLASALAVLEDGSTVVAGVDGLGEAWIACADASGAVLWRRRIAPAEGSVGLAVLPEGGFALSGGIDGDGLWVVRLDPAGSPLGEGTVYRLADARFGPSVRAAVSSEGTLVVAATVARGGVPGGPTDDGSAATGRANALVLALDPAGLPLWHRVYGALYDEELTGLRPLADGWLVAGRSDSLGDRREAWLLRLDAEGLISESCNAYLDGGPWPGTTEVLAPAAADYLPDVEPGAMAPAAVLASDSQVPPGTAARVQVARQCFGVPAPPPPPPPPGAGFTLTLDFDGGGAGRVVSLPAGIDCRNDCSFTFAAGTRVELTPFVDAGFFFSHWTGCDEDSGEEGCAVVMDSNRTVEVHFE